MSFRRRVQRTIDAAREMRASELVTLGAGEHAGAFWGTEVANAVEPLRWSDPKIRALVLPTPARLP